MAGFLAIKYICLALGVTIPQPIIYVVYAILLLILALVVLDFASGGGAFPRINIIRSP